MVNKSGLMVLSMRGNGLRINHRERVNLFMLMEMFMMESGRMIRQMVMEYTFT